MSKDTSKDEILGRAKTMTAEIRAMIERTEATLKRTRNAIQYARDTNQAYVALARLIDTTKNDADDGTTRA